jgi:radical SAM protein with 4Fe4S-binding SPASM domain
VRAFADASCSDAQHRRFLPTILSLSRRHRIRVRVDCSFTPMIVHHRPDPQLLAGLAVYGCTAGDFLVGAKADGRVTGCSFATPPADRPQVDRLASYWQEPGAFAPVRSWRRADEPCRSCDYHTLCRGGCKVVSRHLAGDERLPDPQCPRVVDWAKMRRR